MDELYQLKTLLLMDLRCTLTFALVLVAAHGFPKLLFTNHFNICTVEVAGGHRTSHPVISGLKDAAALDFLYDDQTIFWTDISQERIKSAWIGGQPNVSDVITTGLVSPDGIACDWVTGKLYWVDSEINRIEASNLDGSMRKVLFWEDLDQPRAITLDPIRGYFYWTDWGETAKIERAAMDGDPASREIIIVTDISRPNGLTIDYDEERIYWTDARLHYIHSANLNGSDRHVIVSESLLYPSVIPFAITVFESHVYWTDWHMHVVYACNKSGAANSVRAVTERLYLPMGVHVFNSQRQPKCNNPCADNNGGCSHLCFLSPWFPFYSCQCPTGVRLLGDNRTCDNGPSEMLLLARRTDIRLISLDTPDFLDVVLEMGNISNAIAIDYDPVDKMIYWTDDDLRVIRRANLNGSVVEMIVSIEVYHPDGIAVDWLSRNLYWTDTGSDLIQVAKLTDFTRKVIVSEGLDEPRAIVLEPLKGLMYWSDWGKNSKIEKSSMDGTDRTTLVSRDLGWPNGLAIDSNEGKLYWADAKLDVIECVSLNGSGRKILVAEHIPHIFGFALLGDYVYWTDWQRRTVERVNKTSGKQRMVMVEQLPDIMGLAAVNTDFISVKIGCAVENGGCSHLCLMTPVGPVCACPFAMELRKPERKTCVRPEALILYSKQSEVHAASSDDVDGDVIVPLRELKSVSDIDFDFAANHIYWTDTSRKTISRAFLNGSMVEPVVRYGLESPDNMAVDWLARNIYWTDLALERIEMARLDGTCRRVVIWKNIKPRALALDPNYGFMYWVNTADHSVLERATLDGTQRHTVVSSLDHVISIAIDYREQKLYWINPDESRIESSTMDGRSRHDVISGLQQPYSLTLYSDFVYWTSQQAGHVRRASKTDGLNESIVLREILSPMDIEIFHSSRQSGRSSCSQRNGGCAHLCITNPRLTEESPYSHHCTCATHFTLASDKSNCLPPDLLVLLGQRNSIIQLSVSRSSALSDSVDIPLALPPHLLRGIEAFDYNFVDKHIYWVDGRTKTIRRAKLDGSNMGVLVQRTGRPWSAAPFDMVVDSVESLVYWSDSERNVIGVLRTDGSEVGVVVNDTQQQPRNLALARESSLLFWTNLAPSSQTISSSAIDGSGLRVVFSGGFGLLGPIVVDSQTKLIFWSDIDLYIVESGSFDGRDRRVVVESVWQPVGLAVHGDFLYWADKKSRSLERASKGSGLTRQLLKSKLSSLTDLVLVYDHGSSGRPMRSRCLQRNLRCSHLCVQHEDGATVRCACPIGFVLDVDGQTCVLSLPCAADQVACPFGLNHPCIPLKWRCDGEADCGDRSDEANCASCSSGFTCSTGDCVALDRRCNGQRDCFDGSDEMDCTACRRRDDCSNDRTCFTRSQRCDGVVDCWDGYDELNCVHQTPRPGTDPVQNSLVVIGVLCGILAVTFLTAAIYLCRRGARRCLGAHHSKTGSPDLGSLPESLKCSPLCSVTSIQSCRGQRYAQTNAIAFDELPDLYENLVVDASSIRDSRTSHYLHLTRNPHPTPVTSDTSTTNSDSVSTTLWCRSRCRKHGYVPPPTLCSTDVCGDDSELYSANEQHRFLSCSTDAGFETDFLYPPPPPTPCSQFLPDGYSGPPSPGGPSPFYSGSFASSLNFS